MADSNQDKVILHQYPRFGSVPNLSPPCLKLETYLRMTKIPYKCSYIRKASSKGKMPWIEYKGQEVADSSFCIEFLSKEFGVDVDDHLTEEQKGMARALLVMLEENTYWSLVHYRWLGEISKEYRDWGFAKVPFLLRLPLFWYCQYTTQGYLHGHGIGRHSEQEIYDIGEKDLKAVSACLGEKKFLFGDKPCLADATLFALVINFIWQKLHNQSPQAKLILNQLKNLEDHARRVKEAFYPDWDTITFTKKSTE